MDLFSRLSERCVTCPSNYSTVRSQQHDFHFSEHANFKNILSHHVFLLETINNKLLTNTHYVYLLTVPFVSSKQPLFPFFLLFYLIHIFVHPKNATKKGPLSQPIPLLERAISSRAILKNCTRTSISYSTSPLQPVILPDIFLIKVPK